jgi:mitochondrial chaperone BCS1
LKLNVYILSLASPGLNDTNLLELLNSIPPHTILLLEDIDAVFKTALTESKVEDTSHAKKEDTSSDANTGFSPQQGGFPGGGGFPQQGGFPGGGGGGGFGGFANSNNNNRQLSDQTTRLTFAGILNALDGIAAQTGRLLFMTTNHKERLDAALIRPGRIDYQLYFEEATCAQIRSLFINFYRAIILLNEGIDVNDVLVDTTSEKYLRAIAQVEGYATQFSDQIPDKVYTMSQIQGIFMMYRQDPQQAVDQVQNELLNLETDVAPPPPSLSYQLSSTIMQQRPVSEGKEEEEPTLKPHVPPPRPFASSSSSLPTPLAGFSFSK